MLARKCWLWVTACTALGCGYHAPVQASYFTTPLFQASTDDTLCISTWLVDGNRQGWQQQQCQGTNPGFVQTHLLTAAQVAQIQTAFAALPPMQDPNCVGDHTSNDTVTTLRAATANSDVSWTACVVGDQVTDPYATALNTLRQFVQTP